MTTSIRFSGKRAVVKGFAKAGHLAALQGLVPTAELSDCQSDVPRGLRDVWSFDGETRGLATSGNGRNLIDNKQLPADARNGAPDTGADPLAPAQ